MAAERMAAELDRHNAERKTVEALVQEDAKSIAETLASNGAVLVVAKEGWHPGVIGIVASRLKERYRRPAFVIAIAAVVPTLVQPAVAVAFFAACSFLWA